MRAVFFAVSGVLVGLLASGCEQGNSPPRNFSLVEISPNAGTLVPQLKAEAAKARQLGRKPFVEVSATWCGPCQKSKRSLNDPLMIEAFSGTYIIQLDADDWLKQLPDAGMNVDAIPVFIEVNDEGKSTGRTIDAGAWEENVPANMAPPLQQFFLGSNT